MSEQNSTFTVILAGRTIQVKRPAPGQVEAMVRIARALQGGGDDDPSDYWIKHITRLGTLLESLIAEGDRDTVDDLNLTGKVDSSTLLTAILDASTPKDAAPKNGPVGKARTTKPVKRVRRS